MNKFKFWKLPFFSLSILCVIISAMAVNKEIINNTPNPGFYYILCVVLFFSILISLSHINDQLK